MNENSLDNKVEKLEMKVELLDRYVQNFLSSFLGILAIAVALISGAGYYFIKHTIEKKVHNDIEKKVRKVIQEEIIIYHESGTTKLNDKNEFVLDDSLKGINQLTPESVLRIDCSPSDGNTWLDLTGALKAELFIDAKNRRVIKVINNQKPQREIDWSILWLNK